MSSGNAGDIDLFVHVSSTPDLITRQDHFRLVVGAIVFWVARRGSRLGVGGVVEAAPACVALSERPAEIEGLTEHSGR